MTSAQTLQNNGDNCDSASDTSDQTNGSGSTSTQASQNNGGDYDSALGDSYNDSSNIDKTNETDSSSSSSSQASRTNDDDSAVGTVEQVILSMCITNIIF